MGMGDTDIRAAPNTFSPPCAGLQFHIQARRGCGNVHGKGSVWLCLSPRTGMESFGVTLSWNVTLTVLLRPRTGKGTSCGQMDDRCYKITPPQPLLKSA